MSSSKTWHRKGIIERLVAIGLALNVLGVFVFVVLFCLSLFSSEMCSVARFGAIKRAGIIDEAALAKYDAENGWNGRSLDGGRWISEAALGGERRNAACSAFISLINCAVLWRVGGMCGQHPHRSG